MTKKTTKKRPRRATIGRVYEVKTFAGVVVHQKIIGYYKKDPEGNHFYKGILVRASDVKALKEAGVAYKGTENPEECEGVVYTWQIQKKITNNSKKRRARRKSVVTKEKKNVE